jgi:hypothetical protein
MQSLTLLKQSVILLNNAVASLAVTSWFQPRAATAPCPQSAVEVTSVVSGEPSGAKPPTCGEVAELTHRQNCLGTSCTQTGAVKQQMEKLTVVQFDESLLVRGFSKRKKSFALNRPWRPVRLWGFNDPTLFRQSAVSLSALRTGRTLLHRNMFFLLLELICVSGSVRPRAWWDWKN